MDEACCQRWEGVTPFPTLSLSAQDMSTIGTPDDDACVVIDGGVGAGDSGPSHASSLVPTSGAAGSAADSAPEPEYLDGAGEKFDPANFIAYKGASGLHVPDEALPRLHPRMAAMLKKHQHVGVRFLVQHMVEVRRWRVLWVCLFF